MYFAQIFLEVKKYFPTPFSEFLGDIGEEKRRETGGGKKE